MSVNDGIRERALFANVLAFRRAALANGYRPVRLITGEKTPAGRWSEGESERLLVTPDPRTANTGVLTKGLRVIDVDVDDAATVQAVLLEITRRCPQGGLLRQRTGSARLAVLYRAALGAPGKLKMAGSRGNIEVLGNGQQLLAHGRHPSGSTLTWADDRSPATVPLAILPVISEHEVHSMLEACASVLGVQPRRDADLASIFPGWDPTCGATVRPQAREEIIDELGAGISSSWFAELRQEQKHELVAACLRAIDNSKDDPRDRWLAIVFAVANAGEKGCPNARELARDWSLNGARWTSEDDFDRAWNSYKPGGTTVGTLLGAGKENGVDLSKYRQNLVSHAVAPVDQTNVSAAPSVRAFHISELPSTPRKRQWLHGSDVVRGAVTLLTAPGGRGKSSLLISLALACASGRPLLGAKVFGGPQRVLLISAEDARDEVNLRLQAAMRHHHLVTDNVSGLHIVGAGDLNLGLLTGDRNVQLDQAGWSALTALIIAYSPDVVILDPLVSVMGGANVNDNAAAALLMKSLVHLAATHRFGMVVAHHTSKNRDLGSADAVMGAASFVNLSRITIVLEPLAEEDALKIGVAPWEAKFVFRLVATKQNLSPPGSGDRWFRIVTVDMQNEEPPTYPNGDQVGVVEAFQPNPMAQPFPQTMLDDVVAEIAQASPPLSPSGKSHDCAMPRVEAVMSRHKSGVSTAEAKAVLDYLIKRGRIQIGEIPVPRPGRGHYRRKAYIVIGPPA